ncbi:ABC transporter transmembrane domain-containing protein [Algoriphagus sp. CAU 1675]|uniref:ABC transporter transmembrane domain-containing protein n=1 Tax=Algoriphagus sp. CAU 1675 TaxID=3032597 RepID=UPI0023DC75AF|nr:ABC transporter transmembrane domain-containing protein [Algoriphagus sp. CAU 1675]MDF2159281.1 ABC transporter transmembrane domain-containing protein [Algoriphagus sp. CAU 1675]
MRWVKNRTLRRYWQDQKVPLILLIFLGWAASVCTFFLSLMTGWFFDLMYKEGISKSRLLSSFGIEISTLNQFYIAMALVILLKLGLQYFERIGIQVKAERFSADLIRRLFRKQIFWTPELFQSVPFGKYLLRYSGDLQSIRTMLVNGIHRGIKESLFVGTGIFLLIYLNPTWSLVLLVGTALIVPLVFILDKMQEPLIVEKRKRKSQLLNFVTDAFAKHSSLTSEEKKNRVIRNFRSRNRSNLNASLNYQNIESKRLALVSIIGPTLILSLLLSITLFPDSKGSPGELLAFLLVVGAMVPAFRNLIKAPNLITKGLLSLEKAERLMRKKTVIRSVSSDESSPKTRSLPLQ